MATTWKDVFVAVGVVKAAFSGLLILITVDAVFQNALQPLQDHVCTSPASIMIAKYAACFTAVLSTLWLMQARQLYNNYLLQWVSLFAAMISFICLFLAMVGNHDCFSDASVGLFCYMLVDSAVFLLGHFFASLFYPDQLRDSLSCYQPNVVPSAVTPV